MLFHITYINIIWSLTVIWWRNFADSFFCFLCENNILINIISDFANSLKEVWLGHVFATSKTTLNDVSVLRCTLAVSNKVNEFCMREHYFVFVLENSLFPRVFFALLLLFFFKSTSLMLLDAIWRFIEDNILGNRIT